MKKKGQLLAGGLFLLGIIVLVIVFAQLSLQVHTCDTNCKSFVEENNLNFYNAQLTSGRCECLVLNEKHIIETYRLENDKTI